MPRPARHGLVGGSKGGSFGGQENDTPENDGDGNDNSISSNSNHDPRPSDQGIADMTRHPQPPRPRRQGQQRRKNQAGGANKRQRQSPIGAFRHYPQHNRQQRRAAALNKACHRKHLVNREENVPHVDEHGPEALLGNIVHPHYQVSLDRRPPSLELQKLPQIEQRTRDTAEGTVRGTARH